MAIASYLRNYSARVKPPRVTRRVQQPTTRAPRATAGRPISGPSVISGYDPLHGFRPAPAAAAPAVPAPAPAVAAPPPPTTFANLAASALPVDPTYDATVAALARQRDDQLLALRGQRTQNLQEYGFNETPAGGVAFDPTNPFSRAALLRKNYQESKQGTQTGYAANDTGFNQNENSLERALIGFLTNNQGAQNRARSGFESSVAQAMADRVIRAQQDLANNPPVVPDAAATPDTPAAAPVANAAGAARPAAAGPSFISGYQNIPQMKIVNGKAYRLGASGKWIPIK
jgi:hypothetical protein